MSLRGFFTLALLAGVVWFVLGFWNFAERIRGPENPAPPPQSQAIVALTGGSLERLSTGVELLEQQRGERLLISGVNRIVTDNELFTLLHVDPAVAECCVDLGRRAEDTLGNAAETAAWAREHNYRKIILVTDDYHMPRSEMELQLAMPEAEIYPYPVRTRYTDPSIWRTDVTAAVRIGGEYVKYVTMRGREALIDLGREQPADDEAVSAAAK